MKQFYSEGIKYSCKKAVTLSLFVVSTVIFYGQNVSVTASSGTATGSYPNISAAFTNINNGTHKDVITITVVNDCVEPNPPIALQATGTGSSSYTSVSIVPSGNRVVTGTPSANRSLIELFGADYVTIDGDDPNTAGGRNLTFQVPTSYSTSTAAIHIGSVSATNPASFINIRNCIIKGGRSSNINIVDNFGIIISGNSTSAITTAGLGNNNINIDSNLIYRCLHGIYSVGTSGSENNRIKITYNKIGEGYAGGEEVGARGIYMAFSSTTTNPSLIEKNNIQIGVNTTTGFSLDCSGIWVGDGNAGLAIFKNNIHDIINNTSSAYFVSGIYMLGIANTNVEIANNMIRDVISARKTTTIIGGKANFGICCIGIGSIKISNNTIGLITPNSQGSVTGALSAAVYLDTPMTLNEFSNNILVNKNNSTAAFCHLSRATVNGGSVLEKNSYYYPNGSMGYYSSATYSTLESWQLFHGKDQSSFIENPPFVSATDVHIQNGKITQLESNSLTSTYVKDIDNDDRPGPTGSTYGGATSKDIGADEFDGIAYIAPSLLSVIQTPDTQNCTGTPRTVGVLFNTLGNALDSVMLEYSINGGAKTYLRMTPVSATGFSKVIPSAFPSNGIVTYRVFALTAVGDTVTSNYFSYNDYTASSALLPNITATPNQACVGSTVALTYSFLPDPTGFNFPPSITNPTTFSDITNLTVGSINNTSTINSLSGTLGTAAGTAGAYANYRGLASTVFGLGKSYSLSLTSSTSSNPKTFFAGYIDLNGDGDFSDANENVFKTIQCRTLGGRTEKFSLYIPPSARPGRTCLRVIVSNTPITNPFNPLAYGEVEDYTIDISPLSSVWVVNGTNSGTNNPQSITLSTIPSTVNLDLTDSAGCAPISTNPISITASASTMNVSITAPTSVCYNTPTIVSAVVTGGCPPYSYSWSNGAPNAPSQVVTIIDTTLFLTVTVTDKNGQQYSGTKSILMTNPLPLTVPLSIPYPICNRGTAKLTATFTNTDSGFWYSSLTAGAYNYDSIGKSFTTATLNATKVYYVAAFRSNLDSVGKLNTTGTVSSLIQNNTGIRFNTVEPITIKTCSLYVAGASTATVNIGLLDKYGSIMAQTGNITPTFAASATLPTVINLNFLITTPDTGYRLVLLNSSGLTTLNRNTAGFSYPVSSGKPLVVTSGVNQMNNTLGEYNYFYNLKLLKNLCVGRKKADTAVVKAPDVPKILTDLSYTQICKDDSLRLNIITDTLGKKFVWTKNDVILQDTTFSPAQDTTNKNYFRIPTTAAKDTGLYRVRIFATRYCTRDTFSREVRVSFFPEPIITQDLVPLDMCIGRTSSLNVNVLNATKYKWYKNSAPLTSDSTVGAYYIYNATYADSGIYNVVSTDSNGCRDVSSRLVKVMVHDTPQISFHPLDTTICDGNKYVIKAKAINATNYQWFKDNGIMYNFIKDSLILYSALISDSGSYRLIAGSYPGCPDAISNIAMIKVNPSPKILGLYASDMKFCENQKLKLQAYTKDALNVKWYKDNVFTGVTSDSFISTNATLTNSGTYYFVATPLNKCLAKSSDTTRVTVVKKPLFGVGTLPNVNLCSGSQFKGGFNTINTKMYQWYKNGVPVQSFTDSLLFIKYLSIKDTGNYTLRINSDSVCPEIASTSFRISVQPAPVIDTQPVGKTACFGNNVLMSVNARNGNGYQWKRNNVNVTGGGASSYSIPSLSSANEGDYYVIVNGIAPCTNISSDTAHVRMRSGATNASTSLVSVYNAVEQCTDVDDWTYYAPVGEETKYIFAVRKNGNSILGKADVVMRPSVYQNINNTGKEYSAMIMMQRFWNYKLDTGNITNPIDVKFYYNPKELLDLGNKIIEIQSIYGSELDLENTKPRWFKSDSTPFTNARLNEIVGRTFGFKTVDLTDMEEGTENGVSYIKFFNVKSLGGGTAIHTFKGSTRVITGIQDANASFASSIHPNPNNGEFNLNVIARKMGNLSISVVNQLGQTVYTSEILLKGLNTDNKISIPNLSTGMYQVIITKDDYTTSLKLQIEK